MKQIDQNRLRWTKLDQNAPNYIKFDRTEIKWTKADQIGPK